MGNVTSRSGELINAVERRDWDEARALLQRIDARHLVEYTDDCNRNSLHRACLRRSLSPCDIIQAMLNASERAPLKQDQFGFTPLHYAIIYSPEEIITMLIKACPRSAFIIDNNNFWSPLQNAIREVNLGWTPLHWAIQINRSLEVIRHLIVANPTAATTTDKFGDETPLYLFFKKWNVLLRNSLNSINGDDKAIQDVILRNEGDEMRIGEIYQTNLLLLQAAFHSSIKEIQEPPFQPLHAAINTCCPWSFGKLFLRMDTMLASEWDREEQLPIHVAAATTVSFDGALYKCSNCKCEIQTSLWYQHNRMWYAKLCQHCFQKGSYNREEFNHNLSVNKIPEIIRDLLATNSEFANIPNSEGRLPLYIAIENEKPFDEGLETILRASPKAINTRDIKTHMYPFLLAAVEHDRNANELQKFMSCFRLLMDNPHFVSSGIPH